MKLKQVLSLAVVLLFAGVAFAAKLSLSDARAQIGKCISNPATMSSVVKQLSAEDQIAFLVEVNEAISKMPGSDEAKAAAYLDANRAAVRSAEPGNKTAMIAEVFATVPPAVLTIINESFAKELLNRDTGSSKNVTDEQFAKVCKNIMTKVNERCASAENGAVRSTFALLMLVRADNGKTAGLAEDLIKMLPETAQNEARTEWVPAALGKGQVKTYEPLLGGVDEVPQMMTNDVIIRLTGPQLLESMLGELVEGTPLISNSAHPEVISDAVRDADPAPQPPSEPDPYQFQGI